MNMPSKVEPDYRTLVAEAETAVAAVKDPELRRAAFEKILERLLGPSTIEKSGSKKTLPAAPVETRSKSKSRRGPTAHVEELINEGFFKEQRTLAQLKAELANRGHHVPQTSLSGPLQKLCQNKRLRRERLKADGEKATYGYSNW
jgi:hypothetical protein